MGQFVPDKCGGIPWTRNERRNRCAPVYAVGLTALAYSLLFTLDGLGAYLKCAVLCWVVYLLVRSIVKKAEPVEQPQPESRPNPEPAPKPEPEPQPKTTGNPAPWTPCSGKGRRRCGGIQELNDAIPDYRMSAKLKQIEILTASILDQVAKKPDKLPEVRQFMNYYLPTTIKLLEQYGNLQDVGLQGENIQTGMVRIEGMLDKVIVAFQKQLDGLFARDLVDITADIRVMEQMLAQNGLTNDKDF